jgi:TatD DNase family protein
MESNLIESLNDVNNYLMIDIGANLTNRKFAKDLDSVVQRAKESGFQLLINVQNLLLLLIFVVNKIGVNKIIVLGTSVHLSKEALRLSRLYPGLDQLTHH